MRKRRDIFEEAAAAASALRTTAEQQVARTLAERFRHDPERFDPRQLLSLSQVGLLHLLQELEMAPDEAPPDASADDPDADPLGSSTGWAHLRRRERPVWLMAVAAGVASGAGLILLSLLARLIFT